MLRPLALSLVLAATASAQTTGTCAPGTATAVLDASDVRARLSTDGMLFKPQDRDPGYVVPQPTAGQRALSPLYVASLWIGGRVDGEVRVAGTLFGGDAEEPVTEFWPGPLGPDATPPASCADYDRIWLVTAEELARYERGSPPTLDLVEWPVGLGAPAVDAQGQPLRPGSRDQTLDLEAGERPRLYGSQAAFWIMNDAGGPHRTTGSAPLGVEVAATAFVIASDALALDQTTVLRYVVTNRSARPIERMHLGQFLDFDLGEAGDDFVGVDTVRSLTYVYNADEVEDSGYPVPPAAGVDLLQGQAAGGRLWKCCAIPRTAAEFDNLLRGLQRSGEPIREGGNGDGSDGRILTFMFPGDPVTGAFWSMENTGTGRSVAGDQYAWVSTPEFRLAPGEQRTVDLAYVFAQGDDRLDSVRRLRAASDQIQALYDQGALVALRPVALSPPPVTEIDLLATPNPSEGDVTVRVRLPEQTAARLGIYDALGREIGVINRADWPAGETPIVLPRARLAAGTYVARLEVRGQGATVRSFTVIR